MSDLRTQIFFEADGIHENAVLGSDFSNFTFQEFEKSEIRIFFESKKDSNLETGFPKPDFPNPKRRVSDLKRKISNRF